MDVSPPRHLKARKMPRQARSASTIDTIFEATIQVLLKSGTHRLTTTRVAERAGVSVGTMYQYFPHKQALLYALNERYLDRLAERMEKVCLDHHGKSIPDMIAALVTGYWEAKTERSEVTRALYSSAVELDNEALIDAFARRMDAATGAMLESAPIVNCADIHLVKATLLSVIFGTVRNVFERKLPAHEQVAIREQVIRMCVGYLSSADDDRSKNSGSSLCAAERT
ncbi:TetR/AcrR family transcriptional regulator [Rhizobium oryziradicis]|uniref:TetR family transcriptional regulator n=1 Tax=Rhizobium oryziradicis TaxID=1867956 RepID=A0A1Q8ZSG4_9HYPH|nr:TetR/AcrR family transcriptional regulator [Rhizobium oryziradicis]OLP45001.1 TetR family transcriptional regulator [Rhizobium oryziradicis]